MTPLSGISNIPFMMESTRGFRSRHLAGLHKKHRVIRIGPSHLSYSDHSAIKDIYGHSTKCSKGDFYDILSGTHYHLADVTDKIEHQRKRKVLSSAYAIKNLADWEHKIADKVDRLIKQFDTRCTTPLLPGNKPVQEDLSIDYRMWTNFFTMDAIVDIGLSTSTGFLDKGNDETIAELYDGSRHIVSYRDVLHSNLTAQSHLVWIGEWFPKVQKFVQMVSSKYNTMFSKGPLYDGIVLHQARERFKRYQSGEKLDEFFQALMESKNGQQHMLEWGEIVAEISIMLNAGSVSTAIAINNTMYLLLKNPKCLVTVRGEIDSVTEEGETVIAYEKVKYLPYLRACVDEAMRIFPPTPFNLPRKTPSEGATIFREYVAGNTTVSMSSYVAHRDENVFPDPETFRPERWLGEEGKQLQPYFITFSAGARGCIGRNISYLEQLVITASVLHRYEFALPYMAWEQHRYEHFNLVPGPLPLKAWRRPVKADA
ncbi:uncharacterized protein TRUGW13939_07481 [Talaromyces rugulosus]|uniref:Cytochrome P450 monooxygenase n=1 Tax=Talaromyces rugulosus TaxID=121627 RepID=A0A7H8R275_TALRU|nr:uncharacterized protein TRUGW13939_07481 [Talaromyces rugulosus]QKX60337.1 hypothetical protein TRUGW13939_07481 [Talaromyces rugulosus]